MKTKRFNRINKYLRKKYLFWRYKLNKNSGKLLIQKDIDRGLGLTTMMADDCIENGYYLYVPTIKHKYDLSHLTHNDVNILCPSDNLYEVKDLNVIIDNHCTFEDVRKLLNDYNCKINIVNGFVYEPLAK